MARDASVSGVPAVPVAIPTFEQIPVSRIKACVADKERMRVVQNVATATAVVTAAAALGSRVTYHRATGSWGEGLLSATLKLPGKLFSTSPDQAPQEEPQSANDPLFESAWGKATLALTAVAAIGLDAMLFLGMELDLQQAAYVKNCGDVEMAWKGLSDTERATRRADGKPGFFESHIVEIAYATPWYVNAWDFVEEYPVATAGVVLGVAAYGVAVFFTSGAAAPLALAF